MSESAKHREENRRLLVCVGKFIVEILESIKEVLLIFPHVNFIGELWNDQECAPPNLLLGTQNVSEYMITCVQNVLAMGADQLRENFT